MSLLDTLKNAGIYGRLEQNASRRQEAVCELEAARAELVGLLKQGREQSLSMTTMAAKASIPRERAYDLIRGRRAGHINGTYQNERGTDGSS